MPCIFNPFSGGLTCIDPTEPLPPGITYPGGSALNPTATAASGDWCTYQLAPSIGSQPASIGYCLCENLTGNETDIQNIGQNLPHVIPPTWHQCTQTPVPPTPIGSPSSPLSGNAPSTKDCLCDLLNQITGQGSYDLYQSNDTSCYCVSQGTNPTNPSDTYQSTFPSLQECNNAANACPGGNSSTGGGQPAQPVTSPSSPLSGNAPSFSPPSYSQPSFDTSGNSYAVGTPEWCQNTQSIINDLSTFGNVIITLSTTLLNQTQNQQQSSPDSTGTGTSLVGSALGLLSYLDPSSFANDVVSSLADFFKQAMQTATAPLITIIMTAVQGVQKVVPCNAGTYTSLIAVRALLHAIDRLRVGTDALVWATLDLSVNVKEIERIVEYYINLSCPTEIPPINESIELYLRNQISQDHCRCLITARGGVWELYQLVIFARREKLKPHELIEFARRNEIPDSVVDGKLRELGWIDDDERNAVKYLYDEIPSLQELLQMVGKNVFNDELATTFRLDEDFEERFKPNLGAAFSAKHINEYWQKYFWRLHWQRPNLEQAYRFLYRLRPDKQLGVKPFGMEEFNQVMLDQDISPQMREWLVATAYQVISIRQLRQLLDTGQIDKNEVISRLQDSGYAPNDAQLLANGIEILVRRSQASEVHGITPQHLGTWLGSGLITEDDYGQQMKYLGFSDDQITQGKTSQTLTKNVAIKEEKIKALKSCFLTGKIDGQSAYNELVGMQINSDIASSIVETWTAEHSCKSKDSTLAELRKAAEEQLITIDQFVQQLTRLGFSSDAIALQVSQVIHDEQVIINKELLAQAKAQAKQKLALAKAIEKQITFQHKRKTSIDKITLNLDKAKARANLIVEKAGIKDPVVKAELTAKEITAVAEETAQQEIQDLSPPP